MPVYKCSNGKYRIGSGPCKYKTKESAKRAYKGYRAKEHMSSPVTWVGRGGTRT